MLHVVQLVGRHQAQVLSSQITVVTCNKTQPLAMINHKKVAVSAPTLLSESDHYKYYSLGGNTTPHPPHTIRPAYSDTFHCHLKRAKGKSWCLNYNDFMMNYEI